MELSLLDTFRNSSSLAKSCKHADVQINFSAVQIDIAVSFRSWSNQLKIASSDITPPTASAPDWRRCRRSFVLMMQCSATCAETRKKSTQSWLVTFPRPEVSAAIKIFRTSSGENVPLTKRWKQHPNKNVIEDLQACQYGAKGKTADRRKGAGVCSLETFVKLVAREKLQSVDSPLKTFFIDRWNSSCWITPSPLTSKTLKKSPALLNRSFISPYLSTHALAYQSVTSTI